MKMEVFIFFVIIIGILLLEYQTNWNKALYDKHKKKLLDLTPREFEHFCADYLKTEFGCKKVEVTKASGDGGVDIIGWKYNLKYVVECKRYKGCVGRPVVQKIHSVAITSGAIGIIMTTGYYSKQAISYAQEGKVILIEKEDLARFLKNQKKK